MSDSLTHRFALLIGKYYAVIFNILILDMKILHEKEVGMVEELIQHLGKQSVEDILGRNIYIFM